MKITKRTLFLIFVTFLLSQGLINGHPLTYNEVTLFQNKINKRKKLFPFNFGKISFKNVHHVQLRAKQTAHSHISLCKWGHFERAKTTLKMLLASWAFYSFLKGFRSFNAENLGSIGQRVAKWPAIKLWEWFDPGTTRTRAKSNHSQSLMAGNFAAL